MKHKIISNAEVTLSVTKTQAIEVLAEFNTLFDAMRNLLATSGTQMTQLQRRQVTFQVNVAQILGLSQKETTTTHSVKSELSPNDQAVSLYNSYLEKLLLELTGKSEADDDIAAQVRQLDILKNSEDLLNKITEKGDTDKLKSLFYLAYLSAGIADYLQTRRAYNLKLRFSNNVRTLLRLDHSDDMIEKLHEITSLIGTGPILYQCISELQTAGISPEIKPAFEKLVDLLLPTEKAPKAESATEAKPSTTAPATKPAKKFDAARVSADFLQRITDAGEDTTIYDTLWTEMKELLVEQRLMLIFAMSEKNKPVASYFLKKAGLGGHTQEIVEYITGLTTLTEQTRVLEKIAAVESEDDAGQKKVTDALTSLLDL